MTTKHPNTVAKKLYDARSAASKRRVGRWNPSTVPYGVRRSRRLDPTVPLLTGLELNTVKSEDRRGRARASGTSQEPNL